MEVKAHLKHLRISPRKVRLVADTIRGMDVGNAKIQLECMSKKSSEPILKLLNSAIANAKNNFDLDEGNLYVSKAFVDAGPVMKRFMPRAMGRASEIRKRTCHMTLVLNEKQNGKTDVGEKEKGISKEITGNESKKKNNKKANKDESKNGKIEKNEEGANKKRTDKKAV